MLVWKNIVGVQGLGPPNSNAPTEMILVDCPETNRRDVSAEVWTVNQTSLRVYTANRLSTETSTEQHDTVEKAGNESWNIIGKTNYACRMTMETISKDSW